MHTFQLILFGISLRQIVGICFLCFGLWVSSDCLCTLIVLKSRRLTTTTQTHTHTSVYSYQNKCHHPSCSTILQSSLFVFSFAQVKPIRTTRRTPADPTRQSANSVIRDQVRCDAARQRHFDATSLYERVIYLFA